MSVVPASHRGPVGVVGLWHLGCVTAACLAETGIDVIAVDPDTSVTEALKLGHPPVSEPGLDRLLESQRHRLRFSAAADALASTPHVWVTFDTPVDDDDNADVEWVISRAAGLLVACPANALVIVSSQMPVGSIAELDRRCAQIRGHSDLRFACVPENLRLGSALNSFRAPDRIVAGVREERDRLELAALLQPFSSNIEWMRVESAEMTKHALNGFLATSVAFINEVAAVCESVGADAAEVSRGLKSEHRIGPRAYLAPGDAFAGGTLARDIGFLRALSERLGLPGEVFDGVAKGNAAHRGWAQRMLRRIFEGPEVGERALLDLTVGIWGLTYKPGTDTLRRSSAVELCRWLVGQGAQVHAHDPAVRRLPPELDGVTLCPTALAAASGADALVVCTAWPEYRELAATQLLDAMASSVVLDAAGFLAGSLGESTEFRYIRVGSSEAVEVDGPSSDLPRQELRS